jgi:hypothetical protein
MQIKNNDGTYKKLIRKDYIKYLGIMLDDTISWRYHTPYICSRISRGIGILSKLRHYLSIKQLGYHKFIIVLFIHIYHTLFWHGAALARCLYKKYK